MITTLEFQELPLNMFCKPIDSTIFILSIFFTQSQINYVVFILKGLIQKISTVKISQGGG
jgi:hypothetical protein